MFSKRLNYRHVGNELDLNFAFAEYILLSKNSKPCKNQDKLGRGENGAGRSAKGFAHYLRQKAQRVNFLFQGKCLTLCSLILSFSAESLTNFLVT